MDLIRHVCTFLVLKDILVSKTVCKLTQSAIDNKTIERSIQSKAIVRLQAFARMIIAQKKLLYIVSEKCITDKTFRLRHFFVHEEDTPHICLRKRSTLKRHYWLWNKRNWNFLTFYPEIERIFAEQTSIAELYSLLNRETL